MSRKSTWSFTTGTGGMTGATDHALVAAPTASESSTGQRRWLSAIQIRNTATAATFSIRDSDDNILWADTLAIAEARVVLFSSEAPLVAPVGKGLSVQASATGCIVNAQGYTE